MMTLWVSTLNRVAEKLSHQSSIIEGLKNDLHESRKTANEAVKTNTGKQMISFMASDLWQELPYKFN